MFWNAKAWHLAAHVRCHSRPKDTWGCVSSLPWLIWRTVKSSGWKFCGQMKQRLNFLATTWLRPSGVRRERHITLRTPSLLWNMEVAVLWCGAALLAQVQGVLSVLRARWMQPSTRIFCPKTSWSQHDSCLWAADLSFNRTTIQNIWPRRSRHGSRRSM